MNKNSIHPLFYWAIALSLVIASIPTIWTSVDLRIAALFDPVLPFFQSSSWPWVVWINAYVPSVFRGLLIVAFVTLLTSIVFKRWKHWRLPLAFVVIAGIAGPGLVVNAVFKDGWERARPYQVENFGGAQKFTRAGVLAEECSQNCSFVSGHVACGFFLVSLMLVDRKRRVLWLTAGTITGLLIGFARISNMDHWVSDVLWAYPVTLLTSLGVYKILTLLLERPVVSVGHVDT
jgi:lipid A 4'-phosphatase